MSNRIEKGGRTVTVVIGALVVLAVGGVSVRLVTNSPDAVAAQSASLAWAEATAAQDAHTVTLYKSPSCTCCGKWGDHLRAAGFAVREELTENIPAILEEHGVPAHLSSCHLGVVGDYVLVGHVPADLAVRMLEEKLAVTGIAVPGMPLGSPGMEGLGRVDRYDVIAFGPGGAEHVYATR